MGAKTRICEGKDGHLIFTISLNQNQEMDTIHCNIDNHEIHWIIVAINLVFAKPPGFTGTDCQEDLPKLFVLASKSLNVFMALFGQSLLLMAHLNNFSSLCCIWFRILSCIVLANIHTKSPHGGIAGIPHQHHHHRRHICRVRHPSGRHAI